MTDPTTLIDEEQQSNPSFDPLRNCVARIIRLNRLHRSGLLIKFGGFEVALLNGERQNRRGTEIIGWGRSACIGEDLINDDGHGLEKLGRGKGRHLKLWNFR
ncbi:hypothetical protein BAC2_01779 [uncultured bacterium]|nr:hypothetical protein BAC2_01779 [uncultured bacterium]